MCLLAANKCFQIGHLKVIERALFAQLEESCTLRMEAIFDATDNLLR